REGRTVHQPLSVSLSLRLSVVASWQLSAKPLPQHPHCGRAAGAGDGGGERNLLGADGDAILGVTADLDAAFVHQGVEPLAGVVLAGGVHVEEHGLADGVSADEAAVVGSVLPLLERFVGFAGVPFDLDLEVVRAGLQTAAAAHALTERVHRFLGSLRNARTWPLVVIAVGRDPGLYFFERPEEPRAI